MALTSFTARQFYFIPDDYGSFEQPEGVFVVTGSTSRLLVNANRTNLANDSMTITTQFDDPYQANSGTKEGWWPAGTNPAVFDGGGGTSSIENGGIIVGGNGGYANTTPDERTSNVSVWGWKEGEDQPTNDTEFRTLAGVILGATYADTASAKTALREGGFYYQFPVSFSGQSPNTGNGSDEE